MDDAVAQAIGTYLDIVDSVLPDFVEGLYVVGSYALGDWHEGASDIDVVVMTAEPATDDDYASLRSVHALLAEAQPLPHIDGPYLAWADVSVAPATGLHRPWTLNGELRHDGDCFEINPITWYTLDQYGRTARGPSPSKLAIAADMEERVRFVVDNLDTYWAMVADSVHAEASAEAKFDGESLVWCALGALRLHCTAFTGDVISKTAAGAYGLEHAPTRFHAVLEQALRLRGDPQALAAAVVGRVAMTDAADLIRWVVDDVRAAAGRFSRRS